MNTAGILLTVSLVWSIAVLCKLTSTRSRRVPYVFTQWDGGLMLKGTELGKTGTIVLLVLCSSIVIASIYMLVGVTRW